MDNLDRHHLDIPVGERSLIWANCLTRQQINIAKRAYVLGGKCNYVRPLCGTNIKNCYETTVGPSGSEPRIERLYNDGWNGSDTKARPTD